ncbi:AAA family ATPase [Methylophilus glucosoxydans]|uniref:AAA family ATPase n=1 Tax=Methylophilus glucosoxydans TaxID=752553 RepID=A0ABW3GQI5_9PROT
MSRADLLVNLVKAGSQNDQKLLRSTVDAIVAEERAKQHHVLAKKLEDNFKSNSSNAEVVRSFDGGHGGLLYEIEPRRTLSSLLLTDDTQQAVLELIEEHQRRDLLRSYSLEPRHRILLEGPPGNGKTSLAEAIAAELLIPLFVVRYEAVIGSFLGETSSRLKKLFDFARTHECVLFFDEFDTLGKERGDTNETGEIKRVVSSLLLQIDSLPPHVVVITATNHAELLDRAVWRRFQLRLSLPAPTLEQVVTWFKNFEAKVGIKLGVSSTVLAKQFKPVNFAELEQFGEDIFRRYVLGLPSGNMKSIVNSRLHQWRKRAIPDA